jgi:hypothetical protein
VLRSAWPSSGTPPVGEPLRGGGFEERVAELQLYGRRLQPERERRVEVEPGHRVVGDDHLRLEFGHVERGRGVVQYR